MIVEILLLVLIWICTISKKNKIAYVSLLLVMFLLMTFTTFDADYFAYMGRYNKLNSFQDVFSTDMGFGILMFICKKIGFTYTAFRGVICVICLSIISLLFFKNSTIPNIQLVFFFILFYYTYTVQLRAFVSEVIIVYAVYDLLKKEGKVWKYIVLIALAILFHYTAIFYYILLLPRIIKRKKTIYYILIFSVLLMPLIYRILMRFGTTSAVIRMDIYFEAGKKHVGVASILFVVFFVGLTFFIRMMEKYTHRMNQTEDSLLFHQIADACTLTWISLGLIIVYSNNFFRINRPMMVISAICLLDYFFVRFKGIKNKNLLCFVLVTIVFIGFELLTKTWYQSIGFNKVFQNLG